MTSYSAIAAWPQGASSTASVGIAQELEKLAFLSLCAFAFTLAWGESISTVGGMVIANWFGLMTVGIALLRIAIVWRVRRPSPLHYWMLALVGWSALSLLWTVDWNTTVTRVGTYVQLLFLVWLIWESALTEARVRSLLQSYVLGALVTSGLTIYNFVVGRTSAMLAADQGLNMWETSRYSISGLNANDLGLILALSIPMAFYLLVTGKGPWVKMLCWLQVIAGMITILLTASRGSLVAALVGFAMLPLTLRRLPRWHRLASLAACLGLLACAAYLVPSTSWRRILRFESEISEGTLTHRTLLWTAGMEAFRDRAFLGTGAGAYGVTIFHTADFAYTTGNAANAVAHNTFLSILVELGVIGALLLFGLLASIFYCAFRMRYVERCLWITLLLTWAVGVSALTWEYRKPTWLLFGLVAAHAFSRRPTGPALARPARERR